jgi:hypothetical protein
MSLKLNSSGGGSVTLQEPVTASDLTVNLPATLGNTGNSMAVTSDASGNVGVGVTPSAWVAIKGLEIGAVGNGFSGFSGDSGSYVTSNAYYGTGGWRYGYSSKLATLYSAEAGRHAWLIAPSGTAGNAITFTQAMTLDASGRLLLGTTSPIGNARLNVIETAADTAVSAFRHSAASPYGQVITFTTASPNNTTNFFFQGIDSSTVCFTIWSNGTTSGRSDERLKKNIATANSQLADVMAIEVVNYEWKESDGGAKEIGWIAQQVQQVKPGLVQETEDGYLQLKREPMVAILWKAVQEIKAELDTVKAELAVLKGTA